MLTAKEFKTMVEKWVDETPEIGSWYCRYDHYKVLGLPSGENLTDKQISEAFETLLQEAREKLEHMDMKKENDEAVSRSAHLVRLVVSYSERLVVSYSVLSDPKERDEYENWCRLAKLLQTLKVINIEKEKLGEYELLSHDDMQRVCKLAPWILGGLVITLTVTLPARICWLIGSSGYKVIQSAVSRRSSAGECSSGTGDDEDIQDWELVNEDDCFVDNNSQGHRSCY